VTALLKPLTGVVDNEKLVEFPAIILAEGGVHDNVQSEGGGAEPIVNCTVQLCGNMPPLPVMTPVNVILYTPVEVEPVVEIMAVVVAGVS
jgi:hypothetical protein